MLSQVKIPGQSIFLRAPDDDLRRHWVDVLQHAIALSKQQHERELAQESGKAAAAAVPAAALATGDVPLAAGAGSDTTGSEEKK